MASTASPQKTTHPTADDVTAAIRFFHAKGWCPATSSNFSFKPGSVVDGDNNAPFYVSVSGLDKGAFTAADFLEVDMQGKPTSTGQGIRPSAETLLHALVYQHDPEARSVLHMHSVNAVVLSKLLADSHEVVFSDYEILKGFDGIKTHDASVTLPIYPNSQDMAYLAKRIAYDWQKQPLQYGFLIRGHGLYAWGKSVAEAKRHVEVFEYLFECTLKLRQFS